jgi:hypothetical protein
MMTMKRIVPLVLVGLGLLLSLGAASWIYLDKTVADRNSVRVPEQLAGLQRTDYRTGSEAMAEFENLHGKQFPITSGAIGIYGDSQATLWAAGADSQATASQMVDAMREKIAQGNSPFTPLSEVKDRNRTVYILEGMGQKHYYFQSKNLVIWLAVEPAIADQALEQTLEVYP